mgnify:CR=1 FL=1
MPAEVPPIDSQDSVPDHSRLANPAVLLSSPKPHRPPASGHKGKEQDSSSFARLFSKAPDGRQVKIIGFDFVQQQIKNRGFCQSVSKVMAGARRPNTYQQYATYYARWWAYCLKRKVDPHSPSIQECTRFIDILRRKLNLKYSALCTAKAAINSIANIDGKPAGAHPDFKMYMAGVAQLLPRIPRYSLIWDHNQVLDCLRAWSPNKELTKLKLAMKLLVLLLLVTGQRVQTMNYLHLDDMQLSKCECKFLVTENLKHSRGNGPATEVMLKSFPTDRRICPITCLKAYLKRTQPSRNSRYLFVTSVPPYKRVSHDTLSRWVRTTLTCSGIDTSKFGPHSTRAASASAAAKAGVPIQSILKQGTWKSANTFTTWYQKPIYDPGLSYQNAILNNNNDSGS